MTYSVPETRDSLILRLPDQRDVEAWDQFTSIYKPLIYRLARNRGFQDADAQELVQEVLIAVARAVQRWQPDPERGRFRDWLFRIARNLMINFLTRRKHRPLGQAGEIDVAELLAEQSTPACEESALFDLEYRREVLHWAATIVQQHVKQLTWKAFWMTSVESRAADVVASELGMSVGAVHIARSRVLGRLRAQVRIFEQHETA